MGFKYVVAVIRRSVLKELETKLASLGVQGFTISKVRGQGEYINVLAKDHLVGHMKIELFVDASNAEAVADAILDVAHSDVPGAGVMAVMPVEKFLHIRTRSGTLSEES